MRGDTPRGLSRSKCLEINEIENVFLAKLFYLNGLGINYSIQRSYM
jgi:hypothetical protein